MPNCPVCGTEIPDTARFCSSCGHTLSTPIAVDAPASMKNSSPSDEQPIEVSTVPTRSLANNNEKEKERAQASLPSGSTSSEEQPVEVSAVPTRSLANNNEKEKERAQASLPSSSTSSEEQPTASSQYPEREDNGELPDHANLADISTTNLALENGNGMPSVK